MRTIRRNYRKRTGRHWPIALAVIFLFLAHMAMAIGRIELAIEQLFLSQETDTSNQSAAANSSTQIIKVLQLDKLSLSIDFSASPIKINIALEKLNLPQPYSDLKELIINCLSLTLQTDNIACTQGTIAIKGLFDEYLTSADFNFQYHPQQQEMSIKLDNMDIGQGRAALDIQVKNQRWQVLFEGNHITYQPLKKYIHHYFQESLQPFNELDGSVNLHALVSGTLSSNSTDNSSTDSSSTDDSIRFEAVELKGQINDLHYATEEDVGENLALNFTFKLSKAGDNKFSLSTILNKITGELLQDDIYLAFTGNEQLEAHGSYHIKNQRFTLKQLNIMVPEIVKARLSGQIALSKKTPQYDLLAQLDFHNLESFNKLYLSNILDGSDYENLAMQGALQASIKYTGQQIELSTQFNKLTLSYNDLAIINAKGQINWNNDGHALDASPTSQLSWQSLSLNHVPLGPALIGFKAQGDRLKTLEEIEIPVFDGFLHINTLELAQIGQSSDSHSSNTGMTIAIDGMIKPISLERVSNHFDWPLLDGKLSAVIPYTTYNEHLLEVGGAIMMQVFGGVIIVKDLQIEQPLSTNARLFANIDLNNIDLQSLTKTYNFGEIEGRVEGKFSQLQMDAWEPIAFDAYIRTPVNDRSNHRISQRAIDNLSSLGGASGILSRSFLSFFETFRYDKLGLSCKLKNNICRMNGIEPSSDGRSYYIVKGGGIPRIDVMGFQHQVNWQVLTSRLKAIQSANQAVIE